MSVNTISVKCPECGASLSFDEGRTTAFCSYCGSKVLINNENEHVYRHIDEAKKIEAETDRMVRIRELEIEEKNERKNTKFIIAWISICMIFVVLDIIGLAEDWGIMLAIFVGMWGVIFLRDKLDKDVEKRNLRAGKIKIKKSVSDFKGKDYQIVLSELQGLGFENIRVNAMGDLTTGLLKRPGKIEMITIDGNDAFSSGKWFNSNATIIISYHSFAKK